VTRNFERSSQRAHVLQYVTKTYESQSSADITPVVSSVVSIPTSSAESTTTILAISTRYVTVVKVATTTPNGQDPSATTTPASQDPTLSTSATDLSTASLSLAQHEVTVMATTSDASATGCSLPPVTVTLTLSPSIITISAIQTQTETETVVSSPRST